jgi:hypothetical protein
MSKSNTIVARRRNDGTVEQVMPDGATRPFAEKTDWGRLRAMTDEEVTTAALADPDALPLATCANPLALAGETVRPLSRRSAENEDAK